MNSKVIISLQAYLKRLTLKDVFPYLGLLAVTIFFQVSTGKVFTAVNFKALLNDGFYIIIGAVGYIFIIAQGKLDFSLSGTMSAACAVAAIAAQKSALLAAPAAVFTGVIIGIFNGFFVARWKLDSFIATMAFNYVLVGITVILLQGGVIPVESRMLEWNTTGLKLAVVAAVVVLGFVLFNFTAYGKQSKAVGASEETARQSGVNVAKIKYTAFIIMAALAGLLGFFSLIRTGTASSRTGSEFLTNTWNAVLLGGVPIEGGATTKFRGAIVGSLTMAFLSNGMSLMGVGAYAQQLITGIIFITVITISFNRKNLTEIK